MPTFDEMGVKRIDVDLWYAFFVPAKTPVPIVSRLNTEFMAILRTNEIKELLGRAGLDASASTPQELNQIVVKDYPRWGNVIRSKQIEGE